MSNFTVCPSFLCRRSNSKYASWQILKNKAYTLFADTPQSTLQSLSVGMQTPISCANNLFLWSGLWSTAFPLSSLLHFYWMMNGHRVTCTLHCNQRSVRCAVPSHIFILAERLAHKPVQWLMVVVSLLDLPKCYIKQGSFKFLLCHVLVSPLSSTQWWLIANEFII